MLDGFREEDVYMLTSSFIAGYGILYLAASEHLLGLTDVNIVVQSTALGLLLTGIVGKIAKIYAHDTYYKDKAEKKLDEYNDAFEILKLIGGSLLTVLGIIL